MKEYKYKINGNEYNVAIIDMDENTAAVEVNGVSYKVDILSETGTVTSKPTPRTAPAPSAPVATAPSAPVSTPAPAPEPVVTPASTNAVSGKAIQSPLPGVIIDIKVSVGDSVKAGQTVAILEAMKMENAINAESDGVVTAVKVNKGDSILEGADIVVIG